MFTTMDQCLALIWMVLNSTRVSNYMTAVTLHKVCPKPHQCLHISFQKKISHRNMSTQRVSWTCQCPMDNCTEQAVHRLGQKNYQIGRNHDQNQSYQPSPPSLKASIVSQRSKNHIILYFMNMMKMFCRLSEFPCHFHPCSKIHILENLFHRLIESGLMRDRQSISMTHSAVSNKS